MGKNTGFLEIGREIASRRPVSDRVKDWKEVYDPFPKLKVQEQGARCMIVACRFATPAARCIT